MKHFFKPCIYTLQYHLDIITHSLIFSDIKQIALAIIPPCLLVAKNVAVSLNCKLKVNCNFLS